MLLAADWGVGEALLSMIYFAFIFMWIWLFISVSVDIFRSRDMGGFAKVLWLIFVIVTPYLGVFIYLVVRGDKMRDHAIENAKAQDEAMRSYVQSVGGASTADEIAKLADLRDKGVITAEEFEAGKAKHLNG